VGSIEGDPYAFILSDILEEDEVDLSDIHRENMSKTGHTIILDFGIGNKKYLGCGLGSATLSEFITFYRNKIDNQADTFFIDPDENNTKAIWVYNKAGFAKIGQCDTKQGYFVGNKSDLMVKKY